ncbi:DUF1830 domain-containing protein [Anthocerotibacter panamensis]|uniref:DUF1830 domain-containing protein n=1 Tax=Anthocerotibacter panamensis TaxID=2857077 RepID=UPI001C407880|nr:DUF1830 domain-containing protein [Anthocerotibacter panamensis]
MEQQGIDGPPPVPEDQQIHCAFANDTPNLQIIRIENIEGWYFERVVFPGQTLGFRATVEAVVQIYTCDHAGCLLDDHVRCLDLCVEGPFEGCTIRTLTNQIS